MAIHPPTAVRSLPRTTDDDLDEVPAGQKRVLYVKKFRGKDPDAVFDTMVRQLETKIVALDAKLIAGTRIREGAQRGKLPTHHFTSFEQFMAHPQVARRIREHTSAAQRKDLADRMLEIIKTPASPPRRTKTGRLKEDSFYDGTYADERSGNPLLFPSQDLVLPSLNSPYARQQTLVDTLAMHQRCFEAASRNPLGKRIARIIPQFVLGRGVRGSIGIKKYQAEWEDFYYRHQLKLRLKVYLRELVTFGEIFLRYFKKREGLVMRSLDPSTIWDVITDPEDVEDVQYYHQQFNILNPVYGWAGPRQPKTPASTLVIRQIDAKDVEHFKINATSVEKRGRSELFAILGWLQRFREFGNDRVMLNKMRAMFAMDVAVDGGAPELDAAQAQFNVAPNTGAVLIHNKGIEVDFKNANNNANEAKTDAEMLLKIIAVGAGISEQFLGVSYGGTRAGALIQTEPDVKNFEDYREVIEELLSRTADRVWVAKGWADPDPAMEFTFPSIAQEERSSKIKDIAFAEAMDYFSKARSATMVAREFEITNYDYPSERALIQTEREGTYQQVMATGLQQMPKIGTDPAAAGAALQDNPTLLPEKTSQTGGEAHDGIVHTSGEMGFAADKGGRGLPNTQVTLARDKFTRGGEAAAITGNKSSSTPLRHASAQGRSVWADTARRRSLTTRRKRKIERLLQSYAVLEAERPSKKTEAAKAALLREINSTRQVLIDEGGE